MRVITRKPTLHGVGPSDELDWDELDAEETSPESGRRATLTCPPPSVASSRPPARYSFIARRQTRSLLVAPLPTDDAPVSSRRPTLRLNLDGEPMHHEPPSVRESAACR